MIYSMVIQGGSSGLAYKLAMQWPASFCSTLSTKVFYYSVYEYICGAINIGYPQKDKKNIIYSCSLLNSFRKKNETLAIKREKIVSHCHHHRENVDMLLSAHKKERIEHQF